jgi:hypothetical protein
MTTADDIAGFVAAACTQLPLSQWPIGEWGMCGNVYTPNQIVAIASKIRGTILRPNLIASGPLTSEYFSRQTILDKYQQEDKADVAQSFRWLVLIAILNDELYVEHQAHGVKYEFQSLEAFLMKWWPEAER